MLEQLKKDVCLANLSLVENGLVIFTWGNVSGIDREHGLVVIKPSGVSYKEMTPNDMVVVNMDGEVVEGDLKPSSDLATHLELYRAFPNIGGITHTHSQFATAFAQAGKEIKAYGTTHADHFCGAVPCTRKMTPNEIAQDYEKNTGIVIAETFENLNYEEICAALVYSHGPFTWGKDASESAEASVLLENIAQMAYHTELLRLADRKQSVPLQQELLNKHYFRKHGKNSYYGQKK